jgi:hypothetical protein
VKQRKIAISLAVVGAIAAPFVTGAWKMTPMQSGQVPLTGWEKEHRASYLKETNNCETLKDQIDQLRQSPVDQSSVIKGLQEIDKQMAWFREHEKQKAITQAVDAQYDCQKAQLEFERGWVYDWVPDKFKYLLFNLVAAIAGFVSVFALTYLLPAIARRYWRWLNT